MGWLKSMVRRLLPREHGVSMAKYREVSELAKEAVDMASREVERSNRLRDENIQLLKQITSLMESQIADRHAASQAIDEVTASLEEGNVTNEEQQELLREFGLLVTREALGQGKVLPTH